MEVLTLKELKKIEKWFSNHEDDMTSQDNKIYDKISMIIEEMSDEEDGHIQTVYDEESSDDSEEDKYYQFDID